jgi:ABC-type dipeptide/oligopeptide/nickel transport system permease subunit
MMIKNGFGVFPGHPHLVLVPSALIIICVTGFTLIGDGLRDQLDPRKGNPFNPS